MKNRLKLLFSGLLMIIYTQAQAHTSIVFSVGPSLQEAQNYQDMRLMRQLQAQRVHNRFIRTQLANMQLQQRRFELFPEYDQYVYVDRPYTRRQVIYSRQYLNNHRYGQIRCRRQVCVRTY